MADDKIDDILVRLDEIEKLQTELRHLVPRVTSSSSRHHRDTFRDSSASIRFPSLFTFPMISNFASSPRSERVQKSTARINLNKWSTSGNRISTTNLTKTAGRSFKSALPTRGTSVSRESLRGNNVAKLHGLSRNSTISTSAASSKTPTKTNDANQNANRNAQKAIEAINKKENPKSEAAKITVRNKTQRATSKMQLRGNENSNASSSKFNHFSRFAFCRFLSFLLRFLHSQYAALFRHRPVAELAQQKQQRIQQTRGRV